MSIPVIARRLNGERFVILSWSRAILLQMAHPLVATGVAQHSTFRGGAGAAAQRAHHTIGAMLSLTFGDDPAREATLARIRGIHRTVRGTLPRPAGPFAAGTPYSAEDPELLLWVHATLLDSIPDMYQRLVAPLAPEELDAFCAESAPTLVALGGDAARAPRTWRALCEYTENVYRSGVLAITREARDIADGVLTPRISRVPFPGGSLHRLITIGLLPESIRSAYGFAWDAARARRFDRALRFLRAARRLSPDVVARWSQAR
ncbi:MAG TPA: oxygenase MpaB family protein [Vicinamibacterales bacterium]|nr:oxygenase MpaB family protein [Vicinamibacterales bacterium]